MCRQEAALNVIKGQTKRGGLSKAALTLHEEQCKDFKAMSERIDKIEDKLNGVDKKVDEIMTLLKQKDSFLKSLKEILSNKVFLYILVVLVALSFGVPVAEVGTFLFKGE